MADFSTGILVSTCRGPGGWWLMSQFIVMSVCLMHTCFRVFQRLGQRFYMKFNVVLLWLSPFQGSPLLSGSCGVLVFLVIKKVDFLKQEFSFLAPLPRLWLFSEQNHKVETHPTLVTSFKFRLPFQTCQLLFIFQSPQVVIFICYPEFIVIILGRINLLEAYSSIPEVDFSMLSFPKTYLTFK